MKKRIITIFFLFFLCYFGSIFFTFASENNEAGDMWLDAYGSYEKAEHLYDSGDYANSFVYYQKAVEKFNILHDKYPDWNEELVTYRIEHCEEKESLIKGKLVQDSMDKSSNDLIRENVELHTKLADTQDKLSTQQTKLDEILNRIKNNQDEMSKNKAASEKLKQLMKEKIELEKKYSLLNDNVGSLSVEKSREVEVLRTELENQKIKLDLAQKEKQNIKNESEQLQKQYREILKQKSDLNYRLKTEIEKSKVNESDYAKASSQIESLSDEIEQLNLEKHNLSSKLAEVKETLEREKKSTAALEDTKNDSSARVAVLEEENNSLRDQIQLYQKNIDKLNLTKSSYAYELDKLKDFKSNAGKVIASLQSKQVTVEEEAETLKKLIREKENKESEYNQKIVDLNAKLSENKEAYNLLSSKYKELEGKEDELTAIQNRNTSLENEKARLNKQLEDYRNQIAATAKELSSIKKAKTNLEQEQLNLIRDSLVSSMAADSKYTEKVNELNLASQKISQMNKINEEKEKKLKELLNNLKQKELQNAQLRNDRDNTEKKLAEAKKDKNISLEKIKDLMSKLEVAEHKNTHTNSLLSSSEERVIGLNNRVNELEKIKEQHSSTIDELNKQIESIAHEKEGSSVNTTELVKKIADTSNQLTEAKEKVLYQRDIITKYKGDLSKLQTNFDKVQEKTTQLQQQYEASEKKVVLLEKDKKAHKEKIEKLLANVDDLSSNLKLTTQEKDALNVQLTQMTSLLEKTKSEYETKIASLNSVKKGNLQNEQLDLLLLQLDQIKNQRDTMREENQKLKLLLSESGNNLKNKELANVSLSGKIENLKQQVDSMANLSNKANTKFSQTQDEYEKFLIEYTKIQREHDSLTEELVSVKNDLKKSEIHRKNLEDINKDLQNAILNEKDNTSSLKKIIIGKDEIIGGLNNEITRIKDQLSNGSMTRSLLQEKLNDALLIVKSLKQAKNELLDKVEALIANSKKIEIEKQTIIASQTKQLEKIQEDYVLKTAMEEANHKVKKLNQENRLLSGKLVELNRKLALQKYNLQQTHKAISTEDKKKALKLVMLARESMSKNDNTLAYRYLASAANLSSDNYVLQKTTGVIAMNTGDYTNAIAYLSRAKKLNESSVELSIFLAICYLNTHEELKAFAEFVNASELEGNKTNLGKLLENFCIDFATAYKETQNSGKKFDSSLQSQNMTSKLSEILLKCSSSKS